MSGSPLQILLSLSFVLILTGNGIAQAPNSAVQEPDSLSRYIDMKYGLDQELFNGIQYYKTNVQYKGNPYFPEDVFYNGSVTLRGVKYDKVLLKYDSYSQQLILKYTDFKDRVNLLIINEIHVDSFCLGINCFQKLSLSDDGVLFYQVIEAGPVACYIYWRREIHSTQDDLQYSHEYTRPIGTYYIKYMDELYPIANRKEILGIFPESIQPEVKKYFRLAHFRFREAGPKEIQNLLNFISSLIETPPQH
jgi:hypothetical protein